MKQDWSKFWEKKSKHFEWKPEDLREDTFLDEYVKGDILEIGCGSGLISYHFANKGFNTTLLDNVDVEKVIKEFWGDVKYKFICQDLFAYNKKYDTVLSFGLCEHFVEEERYRVLKKHVELTKKDGVTIIATPHKYGIFYRVTKYLQELTGYWSFGVEVPFSKKEYELFALMNNLDCEIYMSGFYSSIYDLFRKPLKVFNIHLKRRFDNTKSVWDNWFGSGILVILK